MKMRSLILPILMATIPFTGCRDSDDSDVSSVSSEEATSNETINITATVAELPTGDDFIEATLYSPSDTILIEGEVPPDAAIKKAKLVAKKYHGDYVDIDTAHLQFHNPNKWFINFEKKPRCGLIRAIVGINKETGEATLEPCD